MNIQELLNKYVSYQSSAWAPLSKEMTIQQILTEIKSSKYKVPIDQLRAFIQNEQLEEYNLHKKSLPAVTFCGAFEGKRKRELLKSYTQIIVLDIDKLNSNELERVKQILLQDKFVFTFWESPSKMGLKGLIHLTYNFKIDSSNIDNYHRSAFRKLQKYFQETYNVILDESGSDTTRLCFFSFDPHLTLKSDYTSFEILENNIEEIEIKIPTKDLSNSPEKLVAKKSIGSRDTLFNPLNKNNPYTRKSIQSIIKYLTKTNQSITKSYDEWYRVAFAIANSFTYDIGEKYYINLCKLDSDKFNETACKNMLIHCYENMKGEISFKTIEYLATQKGFKVSNQREAVSKAAGES
jgi:hypothetical protein